MNAMMAVLAGIFGLAIGSFLNVCIDRLPRGESLVHSRSHCEGCSRQLAAGELVPVLSYLVLRGRCRSCGARIPRRLPCVEAATGLIFAGLYLAHGPTGVFILLAAYACILIVVFVIDLEHGLILNKVVYPALALALVVAAVVPPQWLGGLGPHPVVSAAAGAATGFALLFLVAVLSQLIYSRQSGGNDEDPTAATERGNGQTSGGAENQTQSHESPGEGDDTQTAMGWGDVKLAAFMGAATGFPIIFVALFVGIILGGVVGILLLALRKKGRKQAIPFGPFLAAGTMASLLWGSTILQWYLGLM